MRDGDERELEEIAGACDRWGERVRARDAAGEGGDAAARVLEPLLARRRRRAWPWVLAAAAIAAIVWLAWPGRRGAADLSEETWLSPGASGWTLLAPVGHVAAFGAFAWEPAAASGVTYEIELYDADPTTGARPFHRAEVLAPRWVPDVELPETLWWKVILKDADGRDVEHASAWASRSRP